jgi:4-amino-4-deoxy-L-arabinose transferase-like glycosyltransferase
MADSRSARLAWLVAGAMALRLTLAAGAWRHPERLTAEEDSSEYVQLAHNLAAGHGFSQAAAPPYDPDVRRTPVYPAVLAAVFSVPGAGTRAAALAGAIISAITVAATFRVAAALLGETAGWWAALLLALDLTSATYATQLLTEPLFTLLLVLSLLPLAGGERGRFGRAQRKANHRGTETQSNSLSEKQKSSVSLRPSGLPSLRDPLSPLSALAAGTLSGLAALCRPIGVFAFLTLAPLCRLRSQTVAGAARAMAIVAIAACALTAGWTLRNYRASGTATVSSVAATNLYFHRAVYVEAFLQDRRVEDLRAEWQREFAARASTWSEAERVRWMNEHGRGAVLAHPFVYAWVSLRSVARMLTPDHIVLSTLTGGDDTTAFHVLRGFGRAQLAVVYLMAAVGKLRLWRTSSIRAWAISLPIAYFVVIGGPEMYPRFRVPIMPFVSMLAASAVARNEGA